MKIICRYFLVLSIITGLIGGSRAFAVQQNGLTASSLCPALSAIRQAAVSDLRKRHLAFPISGIDPETIKGSFYSKRGCRLHEAADIMTPTGTPVHAVEDGSIARLFLSKAGGITVYQYDPARRYVYYYAHLLKYAPDLKEGQSVKKGEVIAWVDTTGNAPKNAPHLHFSISVLNKGQGWWQGISIDPYEVFKR